MLQPRCTAPLVRLGNRADGGYVLPAYVMEECDSLLALGMGENWTFEKDLLAARRLSKIVLYDDTVGLVQFRKGILDALWRRLMPGKCKPGEVMARLRLLRSYKELVGGVVIHRRLRIAPTTSIQAGTISFEDAFSEFRQSRPVVKVDIEDAEWGIIEQIAKESCHIPALIMEIHAPSDWDDFRLGLLERLLGGFALVHTHANNFSPLDYHGVPKALEITLIHRKYEDRLHEHRQMLPLEGLDFPCNALKPDYTVTFQP